MEENESPLASDAAVSGASTADREAPVAAIHEPVSPPAEVTPVRGTHRATGRWGIALLVSVAVLALASAAILFVSAGASVSRLAGWAPAGTAMYAELRLQAPGDQAERIADLLGRFPGFADRSQLDAKLTDSLDRAFGDATGGKVTFSSMKPWLGDAIAIAAQPTSGASDGTAAPLVIVATKDPAATRDWLAATASIDGATTEAYGGAELTTGTSDGRSWAYTVVDDVLLAGEKGAVEAAVDTKGSSSFATSEPFRSAAAAMRGDAFGFAFMDPKAILEASLASGAMPGSTGALDQAVMDRLPAWIAATTRANADSLQVDVASPRIAGYEPAGEHASTLASRLPAGTLVAAEVRDVGKVVLAVIEQLKADPRTAQTATQLEQALATAGGPDATVGWMGDGSVTVANVGGKPTAGLVVATTDEAAAGAKLLQLRNLLALAGAGGGSSAIKVTEEPYGDGTITTVDLGDLRALAGATGATGAEALPAGDVSLSFTVQRGLLVIGADDAFVKAVLDTSAGSSLADQPRYKTALDLAGTTNAGQVYVDLVGLLDVATPAMPADERARFERDMKPFTDQLQALAGARSTGDPMRVRFVVTVK